MKYFTSLITILALLLSCKQSKEAVLNEGVWRGTMEVMDNQELPFNFTIEKEGNEYVMEMFNADEVLRIDEITMTADSIYIKMPVFEGYIAGTHKENSITGSFIKESLDRVVPFSAVYGDTTRFKSNTPEASNVSGIWETTFSSGTEEQYIAKGIFNQIGPKVTGTIRTTTGDYRYLEGVMEGDSLKLSTFDGAHVFLFQAKVGDSTLQGTFYSGNHFKEPFEAKRNDLYELPDADSLTFIKEGYEKFSFAFPDADGAMVSLEDEQFKDKVVVVQIMGTWCPNCLDETKFLVRYLEKTPLENVAVVGIAFEYAKTEEKAYKAISRLKERIGVTYPIVLAQY
ncbi:MAG: TlpA family protein disulfide reductase, partial [Muriicola sp.]|nr:TlpA family protein disulfide reductase [Muriicola sp.]